jgi:hypothetical protein
MTRPRQRAQLAAVAALATGTACAHPKPVPPKQRLAIPASYEAVTLAFPTGARARELAVCTPGLVVVPVAGGLYLAGFRDWLRAPDKHEAPITSVDCDEAQHVFFIRNRKLMLLGNDQIVPLADLPAGDLHVAATIDSAVWIWGITDRHVSIVLRFDRGVGLQQVAAISTPIHAAAVVGTDALVTAVGPKIVLWQRGADPKVLATLPQDPDGVAVQPGGNLWVSVPSGILSLDAQGAAKVFAAGLHGPMRARGRSLFVLLAENAQVIRLRPRGERDEAAPVIPPAQP